MAWASSWYALASLIGLFVPFVARGALSWNGAVPFYLGAATLFGWWALMAVVMLRDTRSATPDERLALEVGP